ncbi:hypothetical protein [Amycolatopsis silviterrae]|uniref:WXG100 family type VII secretion target n=1 Tax=Amycolatopsis silviterrae TaxID=1656914 RepID=A0ABW5HK44_9PSEU
MPEGNSGLHMETAGAEKAFDALARAREAIAQAWTGGASAIDGANGQLGKGKIGQAFMSVYQPEVQNAGTSVQLVTGKGAQLFGAGRASIADYLRSDDGGKSAFAGLREGN